MAPTSLSSFRHARPGAPLIRITPKQPAKPIKTERGTLDNIGRAARLTIALPFYVAGVFLGLIGGVLGLIAGLAIGIGLIVLSVGILYAVVAGFISLLG